MAEFSNKREGMVFLQIKSRGITDERVLSAFLDVLRENFVQKEDREFAYHDSPLEIGYGQTISQPYIVALMTSMLEVDEDDIVLEIGTGSGYQSAILSKLANEVVSYEIVPELCRFASSNLMKSGIENVKIICEDGSKIDHKECFDKIIITAATAHIPMSWFNALKIGGILVVPEGDLNSQILVKYKKTKDRFEIIDRSIPVRFVPLTGEEGF